MLLSLRQESAGFAGRPVLHCIDLDIQEGEHVAIMGRSGAGKSTLLQLIYTRLADQAALVPQAAALVGNLSVFHNVYMGRLDRHSALRNLRMLAWPAAAELEVVRHVLEGVGLAEQLRARAGALSGGQQQRVSVARALYNARPVVIGDEPVSALDRRQGAVILCRMAETHGTMILALHDIGLALDYADRVVMLDAGRIVLNSPASAVRDTDLLPHYA